VRDEVPVFFLYVSLSLSEGFNPVAFICIRKAGVLIMGVLVFGFVFFSSIDLGCVDGALLE
jgi:hypothetical protein